MPRDFKHHHALLYGIQPPQKEREIESFVKFNKNGHSHPEIEERLARIEEMLAKLLEKK